SLARRLDRGVDVLGRPVAPLAVGLLGVARVAELAMSLREGEPAGAVEAARGPDLRERRLGLARGDEGAPARGGRDRAGLVRALGRRQRGAGVLERSIRIAERVRR